MLNTRVVIIGGPRCGKSTIAHNLGLPVYCGDPRSQVKEPVEGVAYLPDCIPFSGPVGAAAWVCAHWFTMPGPWVCEGHVMARALRRWLVYRASVGEPCDKIIVLRRHRAPVSAEQARMHKGVMSVWNEIEPQYKGLVT